MRCNQVSIFIERFGKYVPADYPQDDQRISVYVDDYESIYAALSKAYAMAIEELSEYERIGARADVRTNEFSGMHGDLGVDKRCFEDDVNWQYDDTRLKLCEDYIWVYEHYREITDVLKSSANRKEAQIALKEKFDISDYQVKKLLQFRFDMLTEQEYQDYKEEAAKLKEKDDNIKSLRYVKRWLRELEKEISELNAFLSAAEHYSEFIDLMAQSENFNQFAESMQKKFGFERNQALEVYNMSVSDFSKKRCDEVREKLKLSLMTKTSYEKVLEKEKS